MSDNLKLYDMGRSVPANAQKSFSNGRFSGTDINPMWRIKKLTEMFGPVGFGWYTEVTRQETVSTDEGNMMVFVDLNLYVKDGDAWSKPIFGTGGNTLKVKGRGDDEGYKKAYTDALSIACKALGIGADIWYSADVNADYSSKYASMYTDGGKGPSDTPDGEGREIPARASKPAPRPATDDQKAYIREHATDDEYMDIMKRFGPELGNMTEQDAISEIGKINMRPPKCDRCGGVITGIAMPDGKRMTASEIIAKSKETYKGQYCLQCMKALSNKRKAG